MKGNSSGRLTRGTFQQVIFQLWEVRILKSKHPAVSSWETLVLQSLQLSLLTTDNSWNSLYAPIYILTAMVAIISSDDWQFLELTVCAHLCFNCNACNYISWRLTILGTHCMPIYTLTPILGALAAVRWLIFNLTRQKIWHGMLLLRRRAVDPYFAPFWPDVMQHFMLWMTCSYAAYYGGELHRNIVYINGFITR